MKGDATLRQLLDDAIATHAGTYDDAWRKVIAHGNHQVWPVVLDRTDALTFNCYAYPSIFFTGVERGHGAPQ